MSDRVAIAGAVLAVAVVLAVYGWLAIEAADCRDEGGKFVRGLYGMECVK